jgi:hypothetical protein
MPSTNLFSMAKTFSSQSSAKGRHNGSGGGVRSGWCNTLTNRVRSEPDGCSANGSFAVSLMRSCAGQIMISHLKGILLARAARRTLSLTSFRTTKVPTAPMLTTPKFANCFAISAGRQRFVPPTLTARRKTTQCIRGKLDVIRQIRSRCLPHRSIFASLPPTSTRGQRSRGVLFQSSAFMPSAARRR